MGAEDYKDEGVLRELYHERGLSQREVANELGVSQCTVQRWMGRNGIESRESLRDRDNGWRDEGVMRELYIERGLSSREVADVLDAQQHTILSWLDKHGIEKRDSNRERGLKPRLNKNGYEMVRHKSEGCNYSVAMHRLLAVATGALPPSKFRAKDTVVHHKNGIPWDNRPENLEVMSRSKHTQMHMDNGDLI